MSLLKLREEDCSALGQLVLQYLKDNPKVSMSELARQIKISHAGLSWVCLRRSNPNEETAERIAQVIGVDFRKIARLVHENKLEKLASLGSLNYGAKLDKKWVSRPVPIEDAIAGLDAVFHAYHNVIKNVPEKEKPTDFQMYKESYEIISKHFIMNGKRFIRNKKVKTDTN
jgi:transcriptional regulator with XRE-family HTH domain